MKLEPVAWKIEYGDTVFSSFDRKAVESYCLTNNGLPTVTDLYAIPAGYVLVPGEPTEAMLNAARDWSYEKYGKPIGNEAAIGCYKAMIEGEQ